MGEAQGQPWALNQPWFFSFSSPGCPEVTHTDPATLIGEKLPVLSALIYFWFLVGCVCICFCRLPSPGASLSDLLGLMTYCMFRTKFSRTKISPRTAQVVGAIPGVWDRSSSPGGTKRIWNTLQAGRFVTEGARAAPPFLQTSNRALSTTKAHGTNTINNINGATAGDIRAGICETGNCKQQQSGTVSPRELSGDGLISEAESEASKGGRELASLTLLLWDRRNFWVSPPQTAAVFIVGQGTCSGSTGKVVSLGIFALHQSPTVGCVGKRWCQVCNTCSVMPLPAVASPQCGRHCNAVTRALFLCFPQHHLGRD